MIFGSGVANGKDIMRSFSVGKDLEDMFVQFAIECIKYDDRTKRSLSHVTRVIVDMFTMVCLVCFPFIWSHMLFFIFFPSHTKLL